MDIGPLERYTGPVEFNQNVRDILDHALFLKQQAEQAGALQSLVTMYGTNKQFSTRDIDRAFLILAIQDFEDEPVPEKIAQRLRRLMHSVWS